MVDKTLEDLFITTLQDIYNGEKQILEALPKMTKKASGSRLRDALEQHRLETADHVDRLEQIFELMQEKAGGEECEAVKGLIKEGEEVMKSVGDDTVRDAGMIAAGQAIEHYEIARYGTLRAWAEELGLDDAVALLDKTLEEEKNADRILNEVALDGVNQRAAAG